jgi:tRNA (guanine37-N1)-methyltransferase
MTIDILTLFPKIFTGPISESIIKRAVKKGLIKINIHNLRDYALDKHKTVDDKPYGGGAGMVIRVDVIDKAIYSLKSKIKNQKSKIILLTPQGKLFHQKIAQKLSKMDQLVLICGHYEGIDARVEKLVDEEISIGDYILTGGEIPAMVLIDAIVRLIPGVVGKEISLKYESFSQKIGNRELGIGNLLLEYPQYTRPEKYLPKSRDFKKPLIVPKILLSGHHQKIEKWRAEQALKRTKKRRPDLIKNPLR